MTRTIKYYLKIQICIVVFVLSVSNIFAQQTQRVYLSGTEATSATNWDFMCTAGMNANKWTYIKVPSCWEQQSFGKYDYGFAKDSVRGKEIGFYKKKFFAKQEWKTQQVNIVFEGVFTDATVKLNGKQVGTTHQGGYYVFRYELNDYLHYGKENLLEVEVKKHSDNASVNNAERKADYWIFGGIYRPVYLEILPSVHFVNINIDAKANGEFYTTVQTTNGNKDFNTAVKIFDTNKKLLFEKQLLNLNYNAWSYFYVLEKLKNIKTWTSETPNLYTAEFTIYKNKKPIHTVTKKFGFRTIEVKKRDGIYLNGVKVKMKGVNRAPFRPETGRTLSKANSIEDVQMMKDMNMNAVRCSHYPPNEHFLDVCDSLGLMVINELAGWHGNYDDTTGTKLVKEMLQSSRHHPSIILWANGNEGGHNFNLDKVFSDNDIQQRKVIHPWQLHNGIETQHYREYNYGVGNYDNGREIVMPTEFLHGQFDGGHAAGLYDYWEQMWHTPTSAGGFLWDFADQAIMRKDLNDSLDTDKYRAADGILGPHFEKEASYYAIKEIWSPIRVEKKYVTESFDGVFNFENRYHFTNTARHSVEAHFQNYAEAISHKQKLKLPSIGPNAKGNFKILMPKNLEDYDVLFLLLYDEKGNVIVTHSYSLHDLKAGKNKFEAKSEVENGVIMIDDSDSVKKIVVNDVAYYFNKLKGTLNTVKKANATVPFGNGPILCEGNAVADSVSFINNNNGVSIIVHYPKKSLIASLIWTIKKSGILKMDIKYFPAAYHTNMIGVNFDLPESQIKSVNYFGQGPYRVWKNRLAGNLYGYHQKNYNNTETGEQWLYPEFKGYYSNVEYCQFTLKNNYYFKVYTETEDMFLRLYTPKWKTDQWHNYELIFPDGDISFMQGIPSIGSKTQRNETTGSMGLKNIFYDYEKDPSRALNLILYFDFDN